MTTIKTSVPSARRQTIAPTEGSRQTPAAVVPVLSDSPGIVPQRLGAGVDAFEIEATRGTLATGASASEGTAGWIGRMGRADVVTGAARMTALKPEALENATRLLQHLAFPRNEAKAEESGVALKRLLKAVGMEPEVAKDPVAATTPAVAQKVAHQLARRGLPLDAQGLKAFQRQRLMAPQETLTPKLAFAYARAALGRETVFSVKGPLEAGQQQAAQRVFSQLGPDQATRMMQALGVKPPELGGDALAQQRQLDNVFVGGEAIRALARKAAKRGISLTPKGLAAFREQHGLGKGSELDVPTVKRLRHELGPIGPRPKGEAQQVDWYRRIVASQGGTWRTGVNQLNVIGLRGYDVDTGVNNNAFGKWNDTLAFVWKRPDGEWELRQFRGTTDPGLKRHHDNGDYNGDGLPDTAHLRPGEYTYGLGTHKGSYGAGNPTYNVEVDRDFNGDGQISRAERKESIRRDTRGYGINHHWQSIAGDVGLNSLGCQVAKLSYGEYRAKITPLWELNRGTALYNLVDARKVLS